ncbi:GAF domain-containing protein [Nocardioides mesophilus]|uniref:Transcriptional regulator n=1 Tax=Nocardioides mesophilus TaxID=433659 RepID=A0A7G9RDY6_9ACTN|nr:helix-turn-helix domain-containing protein [Nocardioides mesophilus]QNN53811.1 transcriptional regulator [Nocardioides mesophilus]
MNRSREQLHGRRLDAVRAWTAFVEQGDALAAMVRPEILRSWERSGVAVRRDVTEAPLADESDTTAFWNGSPLQVAVARIEDELRRTAEDGDLVVAVTDPDTRILWTYGGRVMRRKAETVNFVAGGRWDESSVGTNALDLALRTDRASMVFSAEHYAPIVHNWVCWAAPVHDPLTGQLLGVIDLSTTWDRTHPIGLATARVMARLIENALPTTAVGWSAGPAGATPAGRPASAVSPSPAPATESPGLSLTLLGTAEARLDGRRLLLNRRQTEILALLALHPEGLSLEQLHALVYGEKAVTLSTLKAEVSHLRSALGGRLASRPYRLTLAARTDVDTVLDLIGRGQVAAAVEAYGGDLFPGTNSPALAELADYVAVAVREALLADPQPHAVIRYTALAPYDTEVIEVALAALGEDRHPARALLKGRLAASGG